MKKVTCISVLLIVMLALPFTVSAGDEKVLLNEEVSMNNPAAQKGGELDEDFDDNFALDFDQEGEEEEIITDPIEPINRGIFWFNDKFYFYLLKPVARGFRVVPEPARISISNFFSNLATPVRFVNALLQLKFRDAGNELARFVVNSTVGIGGLFDPAKKWAGVKKKEEDFGQTLGKYGMKPGFYIVLPLLGPSNSRDCLGLITDYFTDPFQYVIDVKDLEQVGLTAMEIVNEISLDKDTYESIKRQALDPYAFIKNAQTQRREGMVKE